MSFSDFWAPYPKKTDKAYAKLCFERLNEADQQAAVYGSQRYAKHVIASGQHWSYMLNASTFLNRRRWEDELPDLEQVAPTLAWWTSEEGTLAKAQELGVISRNGESWEEFRARIRHRMVG